MGGKRIRGVRRSPIVDTLGLLRVGVVPAASAEDGAFAPGVLGRLTAGHRGRLEWIGADSKSPNHHHEGRRAKTKAGPRIEVVSCPPGSTGLVKRPRRWVVERTFAWLGDDRRNSRDYERDTHSSESMIRIGSIHRMLSLLEPDLAKKPVPFKYRELQDIITG